MESMVNHTDEQLVMLVGQGSEKAFEMLRDRLRRKGAYRRKDGILIVPIGSLKQ